MSDKNSERRNDQYETWKLMSSEKKGGDLFSPPMKVSFYIFLFFSVAFFFFTTFSSISQFGCPICSILRKHSVFYLSLQDEHEYKTNISHILFGIGGSVKTWNNRRHYAELWWKPNITRGYVWLDEEPAVDSNISFIPYKVSEDTSRFNYTCWYGHRSALRLARIVLENYRLGLKNVRWFVMGDEDTIFFTENLISVLSKYDHNQMYYVGGNSESVEQDVIHSYGMGYGGGGFAISYPLVVELVKLLDSCIDRYPDLYGSDERVGACLKEIGVPLTKELGFHQVDVREDAYGLLAAHPLAPLVSLHHLDEVKPIFPNASRIDSLKLLVDAYQTDPGRTLQQSFCHDLNRNWSVSVSWGYTVQIYPSLLTARDLGTAIRTFKTWRSWSNEPFTFNTRDMSTEPCNQPLIYFLKTVDEVGNQNGTMTYYKKFVDEPGKVCNRTDYFPALAVDTVKVSALKMDPGEWLKAPRRQCCEITSPHKGMGVDNILHVKIRRCDSFESVTPP